MPTSTPGRLLAPVLAAAVAFAGCASGASQDPDAPTVCFVVDNTEAAGAAGRVYLVSNMNERIRLGEVPMGRTLRRCISRSRFAAEYHFVAEWAPADRMDPALNMTQPDERESPPFFVEPGFEVVWDVNLNRVFLESGSDDPGNG